MTPAPQRAGTLHQDELSLPVARLGQPNPLPPLKGFMEVPVDLTSSELPRHIRDGAGYGTLKTSMPYLINDAYDRDRHPARIPTVVLENDVLRAVFVPSLGGRLWSLTHRPTGRDLLFSNGVLQPVNFGISNAWFAGGIEWNVGTHGHSPTTYAPLHAAAVTGPDGTPVLRMWEYDRLHGTVFSISAWLPPGSEVLYVHGRILNPGDHTAPTYFWANAAVPETDGVRIVSPAHRSYWTTLERTLKSVPFPVRDGVDHSYPARSAHSTENYCEVPAERPWIAALDETGTGLAQASTPTLHGRKTFAWGNTTGCRHWQSWLTGDTPRRYCEFQSGLTTTQYENIALRPGQTCSWTEAYGLLRADPELVHGDWQQAVTGIGQRLDSLVTAAQLDQAHRTLDALTDRAPHQRLCRGSGWGALERRRASAAGTPWPLLTGTPFDDDTLGAEQTPWLTLLNTGTLPAHDPATAPRSYITGGDWRTRLTEAPANWLTAYLLGTLAHAEHDLDTAELHYGTSLTHDTSPWALRALALVQQARGEQATALHTLREACALAPHSPQLAVETATSTLEADDPAGCLHFLNGLRPDLLDHPRLRLLHAIAAGTLGDRTPGEELLADTVELPTMRSSETLLEQLWFLTYPDRPLPGTYNFRWHPQATDRAILERLYGPEAAPVAAAATAR
ncbi:DUF5107 domain-containing protein [Streptomyces sp. LHD-70]|uniref:DUF5107 domain-containing protein n=1 Tax=Streptomyces sp. LHD-70 TaxID=3072140 RepID=UPI00280F80B9|nr:DUF5107 domain-containing protein [Streptomyces sp. LHD-70]MDQ8706963.1 DUF5107 domain-containing protein [Streptomyces sp. LHD-70]